MLMQKAYDEATKNLTEANVKPAEIQAYYDAHKKDYYTDETRNARHILIAPVKASTTSTTVGSSTTTTAAPTDADWAAALATAQKVRADLVGGADWQGGRPRRYRQGLYSAGIRDGTLQSETE